MIRREKRCPVCNTLIEVEMVKEFEDDRRYNQNLIDQETSYKQGMTDMARYLADYLAENAYCQLGEEEILDIASWIDKGAEK